jgi:hypothetical protein
MAAPFSSVTAPLRVAVADCARAANERAETIKAAKVMRKINLNISFPP